MLHMFKGGTYGKNPVSYTHLDVYKRQLLYCAKHQGKILTKQQIYEEVWGEEYFYDIVNIS